MKDLNGVSLRPFIIVSAFFFLPCYLSAQEIIENLGKPTNPNPGRVLKLQETWKAEPSMMKNNRLSLLAGAIAFLAMIAGDLGAQKVSTKTTVVNDLFLTDSGLIPLPANAVELEPELTIRSEHFRSPIRLAIGPEGSLFASSWRGNVIDAFGLTGELKSSWGGPQGAKNLFWSPFYLAAARDFLIVHETDRSRTLSRYDLHLVDYRGKSLRRVEVPRCMDIDCDAAGRIYLAPYVEGPKSRLVSVLRPDGATHSFGEPLFFERGMSVLNSRSLAVNEKGEILIAFTYFPIVRKYSGDGSLLGEYRITSPVFEAKEKFNATLISEGSADPKEKSAGFLEIISGIKSYGGKIYLLSYHPRLEIAELDGSGGLLTTYWLDPQEVYRASDFAVADFEGELHVIVSHDFAPKFEIDIFRKTRKKFSAGVYGEIEKQTAEISANPDHYLAWHNRGVARFQSEDYRGAIEDLSKAIELAPDSALAYHNRGLAKVKLKEFEGAIDDFSKAIELKPGAAAFYDRGIARAHRNDFQKAIGDFDRAAEMDPAFKQKAAEQAEYCRKRIK